MLGPAEADALGAQGPGLRRVLGGVGVRPHPQAAQVVRPGEDLGEVVADLGLDQRHVVRGHAATRAVDRDRVAGGELRVADPHHPRLGVDLDRRGAGDAGTPHAAGDERRVGGLAALGGEHAAGGVKPGDVVGLGERPDQDHVLAVGGAAHSLGGAEHDRTPGRPGSRRDPGGQHLELGGGIEDRVQERLERLGVDRHQRPLTGKEPFADRVTGEPDGRLGGALGGSGLKQEQAPFLDRELDVLHVLVVGLEAREVGEQLGVGLG